MIAKSLARIPQHPSPEEVAQDAEAAFQAAALPSASPYDLIEAVRLARKLMGDGMEWPEAIAAAAVLVAGGRVLAKRSPYGKG